MGDQLIFIPMPDKDARKSILKANLRKSPVSSLVDIDYLANYCDKFSGADLTEICQRAAKFAIRECIEKDMERDRLKQEMGEDDDDDDEDYEDPVPEIKPEHFESAMQDARRSVSDSDLLKYSSFAQRMHQQRGVMGTNVSNFKFPRSNIETNIEEDD